MMKVGVVLLCVFSVALAKPLTTHSPAHTSTKGSLPYLFEHKYPLVLGAGPSGKYAGSKTVLGQSIQVNTNFSPGSNGGLSFDVSGAITVACDSETFSYADGTITVANIGKAGDCLHDALAANQASLESFTFNDATNEAVVSLKYSILSIKITLSHTAQLPVALPSSPLALSTMVSKYNDVVALSDPAGSYSGEKSILGEDIKATLKVTSPTEFSLILGGAVSIECDNEAYTYSNGVITVTNKDKDGDCIHDELKDNSITLESITYDASADHITVKVKYTIITIELELDHQSIQAQRKALAAASTALTLPVLVDRYYNAYALQTPKGKYEGVKSVLGQKVDTTVMVGDDSQLSFTVAGVISIKCSAEAYTYSNGVISMTNIGKSGDCVHDALSDNHCTLQSMTYDTSSDEIQVKIKYAVITISLDLKHMSLRESRVMRIPAVDSLPSYSLDFLYKNYLDLYRLQNPIGTYEGKKTVLGVEVDCKTVGRASDFDITITGPVSIECTQEAYTYSNGVVTVTNIGKDGDCLHDALKANQATLESILYDETADHITIKLKVLVLNVNLELDHVSR